jgi:hypothetical protein
LHRISLRRPHLLALCLLLIAQHIPLHLHRPFLTWPALRCRSLVCLTETCHRCLHLLPKTWPPLHAPAAARALSRRHLLLLKARRRISVHLVVSGHLGNCFLRDPRVSVVLVFT